MWVNGTLLPSKAISFPYGVATRASIISRHFQQCIEAFSIIRRASKHGSSPLRNDQNGQLVTVRALRYTTQAHRVDPRLESPKFYERYVAVARAIVRGTTQMASRLTPPASLSASMFHSRDETRKGSHHHLHNFALSPFGNG